MKIGYVASLLMFLALGRTLSAQSAAVKGHVAQFDGDRPAAISYTFDDNLRDQYTLAVPMLNQVGFKGTFFVIPGSTAETVEEAEKKVPLARAWGSITWSELKDISAQGHEIASHTWSHPNLLKMSPEDIDAQFSKSYDAINARIGKPPLTLAFPFNASTPDIQAAALKYYVAFRAYQIATSDKSTVASLDSWADSLIADHKWGIVMTHSIAKGYAAMTDPTILINHFKYVKSHEDQIWVDTFANVARYGKERDTANLVLTSKAQTITCVLTSDLDQRFNVPLTVVINQANAHSVRAERDGKELPSQVKDGTIYLQAAPNPKPILITWK